MEVKKMARCKVCGKEYEKNIFGQVGNAFLGTEELCPEHSYLWPRYLAESKVKEITFAAFLASLGL
jgi:hypothetical protein